MHTYTNPASNNMDDTGLLRIRTLMIVGFLLFVQVAIFTYWFACRNPQPISSDPGAWGQFGDYIGGLLNPIVSFSALLWLMRSVGIQETELRETRRALKETADAQREQLKVMRRDQTLAAHVALMQARSAQMDSAARIHAFYLNQMSHEEGPIDVHGTRILPSKSMEEARIALSILNEAKTEHARTIEMVEAITRETAK